MTILFSTNIGGIEIKLQCADNYCVTVASPEKVEKVYTYRTYDAACEMLGHVIGKAIQDFHGSENLP